MRISGISSVLMSWLLVWIYSAVHAKETSIYIDQIPLYSSLDACAEDRISAIVRAQSLGCGDNQQLTSFSCFCIDSSSSMSSIISTAVQSKCAETFTENPITTTPLPQVTSALEVFRSYCERSTELSLYADSATASKSMTITASASLLSPNTYTPSSRFETNFTTYEPSGRTAVPIIAIAAPVTGGILAIGVAIGLLFYLRCRRREQERQRLLTDETKPTYWFRRRELDGNNYRRSELEGAKYPHELENPQMKDVERAELEGVTPITEKTYHSKGGRM